MRQTNLFVPTLKESPADAEIVSHQLMVRSGLIRKGASGIYSWLPLGLLVIKKIEAIIRKQLAAIGAQEILMPVIQPAELWEETGRWEAMGPELMRIKDRHDRAFCLGPTHEEVVTNIFRGEIKSYKDLPINLYQIQTKFRDERRPRFGVVRAREFIMKDGYSFHSDRMSFDQTYEKMFTCYSSILSEIDLDYRAVEADSGNIGGQKSHEFHVLSDIGEDTIVCTSEGGYAANLEAAVAQKSERTDLPIHELTEIATPGVKTIEELCAFLNVPASSTLKTLIVKVSDHGEEPVNKNSFLAVVLRGDHDLNLTKLAKQEEVSGEITLASEEEVRKILEAPIGFIGPINCGLKVLIDHEAFVSNNLVCGANEVDKHMEGFNSERDLSGTDYRVTDIRNVSLGDKAVTGEGELKFFKGIEVGHIFQLGTKYSEAMKATVLDESGTETPAIMGCYGMGVTRLVAAAIEQHHDNEGIIWPEKIAPFFVHLLPLNMQKSELVREIAEHCYEELTSRGVDVLFDDRKERPGVKFAEADLIGIPHRLVIGEKGAKDSLIEYLTRSSKEMVKISPKEAIERIVSRYDSLTAVI